MTTKAQREVLLQGQDRIANLVISHLVSRGWNGDYILKNVVSKKYSPHTAIVRVELDSENEQYWVRGEYTSVGQNVLAIEFACIKATFTDEQVIAAVDNFIVNAEKAIGQSFAVRFLGTPSVQTSSAVAETN